MDNNVTVKDEGNEGAERNESLIAKAKSLNIKNPHLCKTETLRKKIQEAESGKELGKVPPIGFSQVCDFIDGNNFQHLLRCLTTLSDLTSQRGSVPNMNRFFDENFIDTNRLVTGTSVEVAYAYYCNGYGSSRIVSKDVFARALSDIFFLFERKGWTIFNNKLIVGEKPKFPLSFHISLWQKLQGNLSENKIWSIFSVLMSEPDEDPRSLED